MKVPYRVVIDIDMNVVRRGIKPIATAKEIRKAVASEVSFLLDSMLIEGLDVALPSERYMIGFLISEGLATAA